MVVIAETKSNFSISHKQAVRRITNWMRNTKHCPIVIAELKTQNNEIPDVIGWFGHSGSMLVECKMSRSDYLSDKNKIFRHYEENGMGDLRYYATPKGLLSPDELPEGWGLLEIEEHFIREKKKPDPKEANKRSEITVLISTIRRLEISTAVFVQQED